MRSFILKYHEILALLFFMSISILYFDLVLMNHLTTKYSGTASTVIFTPIWAFAWWPYALLHKINPFITTAILAPAGTNLTKLNVRPRLSLLFAPLTLMYGSVVSYNIAAIFSAAFAAWTAYFLFYYIFKSLWRSLVGGYFFWYSSYINMISNNIKYS